LAWLWLLRLTVHTGFTSITTERHIFQFFTGYHILIVMGLVLVCISCVELVIPNISGPADRKRRWPANIALFVLSLVATAVLPVTSFVIAVWCEINSFGVMNFFNVPFIVKNLATVAVYSFANYGLHYLHHAVPLLWRFHSVHHSDYFVDASTSVRSHPIEQIVGVFCFGMVIALFGLSSIVLLVYPVFEFFVVVFGHSQLQLPARFEKHLSALIVTPALHHIHHSALPAETDSNFGNVFTIWDRLLGTFRATTLDGGSVKTYGLNDVRPDDASDLDAQLMWPFRK
jgi:sterol desaturase/sphingolipid hydroxylase (fatty acid hydroxylase superfamily)